MNRAASSGFLPVMGEYNFMLHGAHLTAHPSGVLTWGDENLMIVSDLHLGKSSRMARRSGVLVPPYETTDTLARLTEEIIRFLPKRVICLGDSFDDLRALDELSDDDNAQLSSLMAGREWIWIEGNHDAGPVHIGGTHLADLTIGTVTFRHIADPKEVAEISGHYHPKAQLAGRSRPCFLIDKTRVVMPAFGTYTGGLRVTDPAIQKIMQKDALAVLTGDKARCIPAFS